MMANEVASPNSKSIADRITFYQKRKSALETERSSFVSHWRELSQYIQPRMGRFLISDVNRGDKRYQSIINSRATQAHRSFRAGLFAGVMHPTRPWFKLETPDPDMMTYEPVAEWLFNVEVLLRAIFASSNLYNMAPAMLGQLGLFGTGCMSHVDDFDNVARFYSHPVGSYCLAQNGQYNIDTMYREYKESAKMLVESYGEHVSQTVQNAYDRGDYDTMFDVTHVIEPNADHDPGKAGSPFKPYRSVRFESASPKEKFLSDGGFDEFPAHCPRWDVEGEDTYATDCPGMTALGDVKGLQGLERQGARALDKMIDPQMTGPPSLRNVALNGMPGGVTIYDATEHQKLEPIYTVTPQMQHHVMVVKHHEDRINEAFYIDLFRSIDSMEGVQPQNQLFLNMKNSERLLQLGPVLERIHGEFLNRIIDRTFAQCVRAKLPLFMLPPPELAGSPLRTRYISSLAMAQREVATQGIDKLTMFIGGLVGGGFPSAADNYDVDEAIRQYGQAIGTPPKLVKSAEVVAQARAEHQKELQMQQRAAMATQMAGAAQQGAQAVQSLANAPTQSGGSALDNIGNAVGRR